MKLENLNQELELNHFIKFKLYNLEYIVKKDRSIMAIYPVLYEKNKKYGSTLEEVLSNYVVYGDRILDIIDKIELIR